MNIDNVGFYMSQAIAEIRHFRKCLVISRNDWSFLNCLGICRKEIYGIFNIKNVKFWEKAKSSNTTLKPNQANLTLPNLNATNNMSFPSRGFHPQTPNPTPIIIFSAIAQAFPEMPKQLQKFTFLSYCPGARGWNPLLGDMESQLIIQVASKLGLVR